MPIGILDPTYTQNYSTVGASEYAGVRQTHEYQDVSGLRVLARAADGAAPKVVRVHGDYGMRTVSFGAMRSGRPPIIPKAQDVTAGGNTTDVYVGGTVSLPMPTPNEKAAGYNWSVAGVYTFVQTPRRIPGTTAMPTGGYPYRVYPNDELMGSVVADSGVIGTDPVALIDGVAAKVVDHNSHYVWPFTALPAECVVNGLIGG